MYYPRNRREHRDPQEGLRGRRTRSENFRNPGSPSESDLVEETLKEIRSRKLSNDSKTNSVDERDSRRLSCEEIDQLLSHIRSRSQSLSGRPPPPKASPPPLPSDQELFSTPFGGVGPSPPARRNPKNRRRTTENVDIRNPDDDVKTKDNLESNSHWHENPAYDAPKSRFHDDLSRTAAFETVQELKERLASMSEDLEKVRAKADRLNDDLQKEMEKSSEDTPPHARASESTTPTADKLFFPNDTNPQMENKEEDEEESDEDTDSEEADNVYHATVRTTHVAMPKPALRNNYKRRNPTRPESIYHERDIFNVNSSLADQKKDEGNELYKNSNYREALQRYSEAICLCPETPSYYGNRAACYMMLGQHSRALEDAKTSVQLDPLFTRGYIRIAKCCVVTGDVAGASHALDQAHKLEPNNLAVTQERNTLQTLQKHQLDSQQAISSGDRRKALYFLDRALEIATASSPVKLLRAECLAYLGRSVEAQEIANDLLRQDSTNVEAIFVRGLCLYYEDNMDKAFTHFQQVLRLAPDHERAKDAFKRAKLLRQKKEDGNNAFKSGRYSEAYDLYSEALNIDPNTKMTNAKLYFNRATVAAKIKKLQASVDDCTAALSLDEKYYKAQLRRAKSYLEMERYEDAVRDLEALCRTDRTNLEYRQLLQSAKQELKKSKRKDYYKILGVERGATDEEIKRAYRKRALVHHPDRHSGSSEEERKEHEKKFKEIGEAYGVLSDAKERSRYNNGCDLDDLEGTSSGHGGFTAADLDPEQAFKNFFRAGHGHYEFNFSGPGSMPGFSFQFG